jgi:hypothetical protein
MKILALAMLLSVMQATPPIPRQASNSSAGGSQSIKKDSNKKQAPTTAPSIPNAVKPETNHNTGDSQAKTDTQETVVISKLPAVTVNTPPDWWNRAYVIFTGLLVFIGGGGIWAAIRTLRAIESQNKSQIESLRARITFDSTENTFTSILHDGHVIVRMKFINIGGTPAYKVHPETWIEFRPINFEDFTENAKYHKGEPFPVYPQNPTPYTIPLGRKASYDEIAGLRNAQTTLALRIRLTYETVGKTHIVDRALWLAFDGWVWHPKYNEAD